MEKIAIIGFGSLGQSIANGIVKSDSFEDGKLIVTRRNLDRVAHLDLTGLKLTSNNIEAVQNSRIIIIATKPYKVNEVLSLIKPHLDSSKHIVVSTATGISISQLEQIVDMPNMPVFRVMPNIAAEINESVTCLCSNKEGAEHTSMIQELFANIGLSLTIEEDLMEAATVLGACGIAFVLRFIRAMMQGGVQIGFDPEIASKIACQTVIGATQLMTTTGRHPEELLDRVTTPKGCTIAGLNDMEYHGFSSSLIKGIKHSFEMIDK